MTGKGDDYCGPTAVHCHCHWGPPSQRRGWGMHWFHSSTTAEPYTAYGQQSWPRFKQKNFTDFAQDASGELEQENIKVRFLSILRNKLSVDSCGNICRYVKSADDKQSKDECTFKKLFNRCISCLNIIHD